MPFHRLGDFTFIPLSPTHIVQSETMPVHANQSQIRTHLKPRSKNFDGCAINPPRHIRGEEYNHVSYLFWLEN